MYCNATDLINQTPIQFEENIYSCWDKKVIISCPRTLENGTLVDKCVALNQTLPCDVDMGQQALRCTNGTLLSSLPTVCNATNALNVSNSNETFTILNCYQGELLSAFMAASIPTTTTTPKPIEVPREEDLSLMAKVHLFFLRLIGKGDEVKAVMTTPTTPAPSTTTTPANVWIPLPLTVPPEPIENVTLVPEIKTTTTLTSTTIEVTTKGSTTISHADDEDDYFEKHST